MKNKMSLEDAQEAQKFKQHCLKHCLQGTLIRYSRLWRVSSKIIKKGNKKRGKNNEKNRI